MDFLFDTNALIALFTLSAMEIVLGIDNIVFISILVGKVPKKLQDRTRKLGIIMALGIRILLLFSINWVMSLNETLFTLMTNEISGRDLVLIIGGGFLIAKATSEIHSKVEGELEHQALDTAKKAAVGFIILQIMVLDIVFSLDSVITAVGMADDLKIMVLAMVIAMVFMLVSAKSVGDFVDKHPTVKILALSFLILIGVMLVVEGMGKHIEKGYIYFAMAFSLLVELINMRYRKNKKIVKRSLNVPSR